MRLFRRRQLDSRSRRILAAGMLCLLSGFVLAFFEGRLDHEQTAIFHGLPFLVIGLGVILLLRSTRGTGAAASRP